MMRFALATILAILPALATAGDVLDGIKDRGMVRLGVRHHAPPFSYDGLDGNPSGLAVRLCTEIVARMARQMNVKQLGVEYIKVNARQRFPALLEGRTDLHCGPASATLKRRETLDFSILYFVDGAAAAVRPGSYDTVFDTKAGRFGYLDGTTAEGVVADLVNRNNMDASTKAFESHVTGLTALAEGKIDVYFGDQAILLFQIESLGLGEQIAVMEDIFSFEPYAMVMRRGATDLRLAVDRALSSIYDEGLIYKFILDELGNYPLPPEARAVYQIVGLPR